MMCFDVYLGTSGSERSTDCSTDIAFDTNDFECYEPTYRGIKYKYTVASGMKHELRRYCFYFCFGKYQLTSTCLRADCQNQLNLVETLAPSRIGKLE